MSERRLSQGTVEWLNSVARAGEARDQTIARLVAELDRDPPGRVEEELLARRDAHLHLDEL